MSIPLTYLWVVLCGTASASVTGDVPAEAPPQPPPAPVDLFGEGQVATTTPSLQPPLGQIPPAVLEAATAARHLPLPQRVEAVSAALLDRPYLADPLGEGRGLDADPLARYDLFDCLTFVEEVLALSLAADPAHASEVRNALRYGDRPRTYANRRHFMELQWIPGNLADGWLRDAAADYGETIHLERQVTEATWKAWGRRSLFALADDELPIGVMKLEVLPIATAIERFDQIRPGSIVMTVREDRSWIPIWVTHVGFVVSGDRPTFRHSTKMGSGRSRDHGLLWYLQHLDDNWKWKTLGVAILEPVEQHPRLLVPAASSED